MEETAITTTNSTEEVKANDEPKASELFNDFEEPAQEVETSESEKPDNDTTKQEDDTEQEQKALTAEDIKIAEGFEYDKELGDSFLGILNEAKINKETAQKLVDLYQEQNIKLLKGLEAAENEKAKKFDEDLAAEKAEWLKQCQADKEYGGQNWDANQTVIDKAAREFSGAVKVMQAYNLQTHPEIVRMFYRTGKLISEDNSQISGNGAAKKTDPAQAIFGEGLRDYIKRRENN